MTNLQKGLVGHWTMDDRDTDDDTLYDRSAYDNHGSLSGNPATGESGKIREAYNFDGTNQVNVYGESLHPSSINSNDNISVSCWLNLNEIKNLSTTRRLVASYQDWRPGYGIHVRQTSTSTNQIVTTVPERGSFYEVLYDVSNSGVWFHAVYVKTQSEVRLYIDGVYQGTNAYNTFDASDGNTFYIGGSGGREFDGLVDDVRVYNRALSPDEINALYQMRSPRTNSVPIRETFPNDNFGLNWNVSNATISNNRSWSGEYSFGSWNDGSVEASYKPFGSSKQIDSFEYFWKEDSSQTGHVVILYDENDNEVMESGTENYQWVLNDGSGGRDFIAGNVNDGGYNNWTSFRFDFDWDAGNYHYRLKNVEQGALHEGTQPLDNNTGVVRARFTGDGYGSANHCRFDNITFRQ